MARPTRDILGFTRTAAGATASGPFVLGVAAAPTPTSVHLNCGGTNVDRTDSASVVWLYDLPYIISPGPSQFVLGDSVSGVSAPLDQNDAAHQAMLKDMRFDFSSTLHSGGPGVLEYSFLVVGNFVYTLRAWGAEVDTENVTGGRVMTVSYDYGAGTTATFGLTMDLYKLAGGANLKAAAWEQTFTLTATGTQTLRLQFNGGGAQDNNPLISALELSGSAQSLVTPVGPTTGELWAKGYAIETRLGLKVEPITGRVQVKGETVAKGTKAVRSAPEPGRISVLGYSPIFSTGDVKSPTRGIVKYVGAPESFNLPGFIDASPRTGRMQYMGRPVFRTFQLTQWEDKAPATDSAWTEYLPETKWL